MNKKGTLGTLALILGIIVFVAAGLSPLFPGGSLVVDSETLQMNIEGLLSWLLKAITIVGFIPAAVIAIIAIVKNSNRKGAIVGLILSVCWWVASLITISIKAIINM